MALRKLYIVVDCENDEQKEAVQTAFNELSNTRALTSRTGYQHVSVFQKTS